MEEFGSEQHHHHSGLLGSGEEPPAQLLNNFQSSIRTHLNADISPENNNNQTYVTAQPQQQGFPMGNKFTGTSVYQQQNVSNQERKYNVIQSEPRTIMNMTVPMTELSYMETGFKIK